MNTISYTNNNRISITHSKKYSNRNRKSVCVQAQNRVIRVCSECINYSEEDGFCKVLSLVNHKSHSVSNMKSLVCRTREDMCGMDAKYYEPKYQQTQVNDVSTLDDDTDYENWVVAYNPDGSSSICGEGCNIDVYYSNMHLDYIDIY
jgi:hypothetical protein